MSEQPEKPRTPPTIDWAGELLTIILALVVIWILIYLFAGSGLDYSTGLALAIIFTCFLFSLVGNRVGETFGTLAILLTFIFLGTVVAVGTYKMLADADNTNYKY